MTSTKIVTQQQLARVFLYGKPKTRKTWWAGTAGARHRVWILDGENGCGILGMLPQTSLDNIHRIALTTKMNEPTFATFMAQICMTREFLWHPAEGRVVSLKFIKPGETYLYVNMSNLHESDVLVIDSWTKLASDAGLKYMQENNINPFEGEKKEFDNYGRQNLILDALLAAINCLPCHLIVTGHEQQYVFKVKEGLVTKEIQRTQIISSTGKHASKLPGCFSDVMHFTSADNGKESLINVGSSEFRDGGCRNIPPGVYKFPDWNWNEYAKQAGLAVPEEAPTRLPFEFVTTEQIQAQMAPPPAVTVTNATLTMPVKGT